MHHIINFLAKYMNFSPAILPQLPKFEDPLKNPKIRKKFGKPCSFLSLLYVMTICLL